MPDLKLLRNFCFKCFIIGFIFLLLMALILMFGRDWVSGYANSLYGIDKATFISIYWNFVALFKTLIIVLYLIPGIALQWMICCKSNSKSCCCKDSGENS